MRCSLTRTDEILAWVEAQRPYIDGWEFGALQLDWGDAPGFRAKLTKADRVGGKKAIDRLNASA